MENDHEQILDNLPLMVININTSGVILYSNKEWKETIGTNESDIFQVVHPNDKLVLEDLIKTLMMDSCTSTGIQQRLLSVNNTWVSYTMTIRYHRDRKEYTIVYNDSQKRIGGTTSIREPLWQDILDNLPLQIYVTNSLGHVTYYNQQYKFSLSSDDPQSYIARVHPEDRDMMLSKWKTAMENKEPYRAEFRLLDSPSSTSYRWYLTLANYVESRPFDIAWIGVSMDIDEQYRTLAESNIMKQRFNVLMQNVHCIYFSTNQDGIVTFVTGRALEQFSNVPPIKLGDNLLEHILEEDRDRFKRILSTGTSETFESRFYDRVYSNIWLKNNTTSGLMALSIDITDDIRLRQEKQDLLVQQQVLLSVNRIKTRFLTNMSHELRTPLAAIMGLTELLKSEQNQDSSSVHRDYLTVILENTKNLAVMVDDMLDISAIEGGTFDVSEDRINPETVLDEIRSYFGYQVKQKGLEMTLKLSPDIPQCIVTDKKRLRQIIQYIMSNAIKFTDNGSVSMFLGLHNSQFQIIIQDTGCGIPDNMKPRLFQPFTMADDSNSRKHGGSGLGLYITKMILDSLHGTINISSQVNKGTIVSVHLPYMPCQAIPNRNGGHTSSINSMSSGTLHFGPNMCVLLAEDNKINQTIVKRILERNVIQVRVANNGQEAIQLIDADLEKEIVLVLMDIQMPVLDGIEAFKYIHAKIPTLPVVALTANALETDKQYHLSLGMADHISKPFSANQLLRVIAKHAPKQQ